ncbi:MAG: Re/Si-specific NAD(P)(+) transhydrogenase subunit alpha [Deltaproteobacteria bacterium]|nr:Re/Si-specific NAD(P)(+) transhydrogenase subunit alpha [Deltaproteobacteria bacterium]
MIVGVPRETFPGERRVALTPSLVPSLTNIGLEVIFQAGSGKAAGFPDAAYQEKGARVLPARAEIFSAADILLQVRAFGANLEAGRADLDLLRPGQLLIGFAEPLAEPEAVAAVAARGVTQFAMELIPRIARAQSMDALSSMSTIAGYKAVLVAAGASSKMFPMLTTAAGTIRPARVFVIGAGVAGLQAIATARRLGAAVEAYDVRPAVEQDVLSLGAKYVALPLDGAAEAEDERGYARALGDEFYQRQRAALSRALASSDAVITTAVVPGKKAPLLVTAEMVAAMPAGSVIVDLAAERGGNCELTCPGEVVVKNGVTILGPVNLPASVPYHASQMYAKNISTFLLNILRNGRLRLELDDVIIRETLVTHRGEVVHPRVREALGMDAPVAVTEGRG